MSSGGSRANSGPAPDPHSGRSERRGLKFEKLPAAGFSGSVPTLAPYLPDPGARHEQVWAELWSTPQAHAWAAERWRWPVVADLVRRMVQSEDTSQPVAVATVVRQLREDLALSASGLRHHGWSVSAEVQPPAAPASPETSPRQRRLRAVREV